MDHFTKIQTLEAFEVAIKEKSIFLFTAGWCPDCMFIKPFIGEVCEAFPEFKYYVVDRDEMIDLCKDLDIMGIPSFIAFDNSQETNRFVSKFRKTRPEIEAFFASCK